MKVEIAPHAGMSNDVLQVDIEIASMAWRDAIVEPEQKCRHILSVALDHLDYPSRSYEVSVLLTDDARQRELNSAYRGVDSSTNVLSFPSGETVTLGFPDDMPLPLGDITLALETLKREAIAEDVLLADHFCHLLVHGMLHLAGYDHKADDEAEKMEALEINILADLGVANPYAGRTTASMG